MPCDRLRLPNNLPGIAEIESEKAVLNKTIVELYSFIGRTAELSRFSVEIENGEISVESILEAAVISNPMLPLPS